MSERELALIVLAALAGYAFFCRREGGGPIPADVIALDEPTVFQWAADRATDFL